MAYTLELRIKAVEAYESGEGTQEEVANYFQISLSTFKRWLNKKILGKSLCSITEGKGRPKKLNTEHIDLIKQLIADDPSITLGELSDKIYKHYKVTAGRSVISRELEKLNLRYKKLSIQAIEKNTPEVIKKKNFILKN